MGQALILCPGRELAFIENFDLLLHSFELVAAIFQQLGGALYYFLRGIDGVAQGMQVLPQSPDLLRLLDALDALLGEEVQP